MVIFYKYFVYFFSINLLENKWLLTTYRSWLDLTENHLNTLSYFFPLNKLKVCTSWAKLYTGWQGKLRSDYISSKGVQAYLLLY